MIKLIFRPVSIVSGLLAGLLARRTFALLWRAVDEQAPPQPEQQRASIGKLALALSLEGAVFRLVKGIVDHASRRGFAQLTGRWPGEPGPEDGGSGSD
jgi:hypothetical protein